MEPDTNIKITPTIKVIRTIWYHLSRTINVNGIYFSIHKNGDQSFFFFITILHLSIFVLNCESLVIHYSLFMLRFKWIFVVVANL